LTPEPDNLKRIPSTIEIHLPDDEFIRLKVIYETFPVYGGKNGFSSFIYEAAKQHIWERVVTDGPNSLHAQLKMIDLGLDPFVSYSELMEKTGLPPVENVKAKLFTSSKSPNIWQGNALGRNSLKVIPRWERI
jgi:hypothetical protein